MWIVRKVYTEKFKNYILRQGSAQFGEGALAHDPIRIATNFGLMPESAYSGIIGNKGHNHQELFGKLKSLADSCLKNKVASSFWLLRVEKELDKYLGVAPKTFTYEGKTYTPIAFAKEIAKFEPKSFVGLTSFLSVPYFESWVVNVPDNFSGGSYINMPLDELLSFTKQAVKSGYTLVWDADVSNIGFNMDKGIATAMPKNRGDEEVVNAEIREQRFLDLDVQDDHLMQIVGLTESGNLLVKNSWGKTGALSGFIEVTDAYFKLNTITILVSKETLNEDMRRHFGL